MSISVRAGLPEAEFNSRYRQFLSSPSPPFCHLVAGTRLTELFLDLRFVSSIALLSEERVYLPQFRECSVEIGQGQQGRLCCPSRPATNIPSAFPTPTRGYTTRAGTMWLRPSCSWCSTELPSPCSCLIVLVQGPSCIYYCYNNHPHSSLHYSSAVSQNSTGPSDQALLIHPSVRNFMTTRHVFSITALFTTSPPPTCTHFRRLPVNVISQLITKPMIA